MSAQVRTRSERNVMVAASTSPQTTPHSSASVAIWIWVVVVGLTISIFAGICAVRDAGYGGPHHDEVIALMASKGFEREYARLMTAGEMPFHKIVPASDWHRFTRDFSPIPFSEVRDDVLFGDKHPPLAFWILNQWLALFHVHPRDDLEAALAELAVQHEFSFVIERPYGGYAQHAILSMAPLPVGHWQGA